MVIDINTSLQRYKLNLTSTSWLVTAGGSNLPKSWRGKYQSRECYLRSELTEVFIWFSFEDHHVAWASLLICICVMTWVAFCNISYSYFNFWKWTCSENVFVNILLKTQKIKYWKHLQLLQRKSGNINLMFLPFHFTRWCLHYPTLYLPVCFDLVRLFEDIFQPEMFCCLVYCLLFCDWHLSMRQIVIQ